MARPERCKWLGEQIFAMRLGLNVAVNVLERGHANTCEPISVGPLKGSVFFDDPNFGDQVDVSLT